MHFFDGFRTSHEIQKIEELTFDDMRAMIDDNLVMAHRMRGLTPDRPVLRGTSHNPDVYFQARETVNKYYHATPAIMQKAMDKFATLTGRQYKLFDYLGAPGCGTGDRGPRLGGRDYTHDARCAQRPRREAGAHPGQPSTGLSTSTPLPQPFPATVKAIAVLDRTKEPGATGEPLYLDVRAALGEAEDRGFARLEPFSQGRGRTLRPRLQGFYPDHGQGGLRQPRLKLAEEPLYRRHQRRRDRHRA